MRKRILATLLLVPAVALACSEAASDKPDSSTPADSGGNDVSQPEDGSSPNDGATPQDGGGTCGYAVDASALRVVVNEIRAKGTEFVELYNPTSNPIDVSGAKVADTISDSGCPKTSDAVVFPSGTSIPGGGYLVVFSGSGDAGGPFTDCHDAGTSTCWQATWSISNSSGETLWVMTADDTIAASGTYPPNAVDSGLSWGRLPNGTGDFAANAPTPGAANVAAP